MQKKTLENLWPKERAAVDADIGSAPETSPAEACPRCQRPMLDPHGLGWCRACGYTKGLDDGRAQELLAKTQPRQERPSVAGMAGMVGNLPIWFWVLLFGAGALIGGSLLASRMLPEGNCLERALWTSIQVGIGLFLILQGQILAVLAIAPEDEKLGFKDALVPTRTWYLVAKRLPRHCSCLWISCWGLTLVLSALIFIGGLKHWFTYLPNSNSKKNQHTTTTRTR